MKKIRYIFICLSFLFTSCATVKSWFGTSQDSKKSITTTSHLPENTTAVDENDDQISNDEDVLKFSDNNQVLPLSDRQYRKMTRSRMEEESELNAQAGSLWMMEGQTSFLFAQNKSRREGDATNIKLEGSAFKLVETKAKSAQKFLKRLEDQLKAQEEAEKLAQKQLEESKRQPASDEKEPTKDEAKTEKVQAKQDTKEEVQKLDLSDIEKIPVRIIERTEQGFRVRGSQPIVINEKEYKVITTGIIKPEDFSDEVVSSNKMIDAQFDLISTQGMSEGRSY